MANFTDRNNNLLISNPLVSAFIVFCFFFLCPPDAAIAVDPKSINREGALLGEKKHYREAIEQFDRAIEIYDKESAQAYHNRGWVYELNGDTDKAVLDYEEALRRNPYQVISGEKLGHIYYKKGDYENAIRVGEIVLQHDPENEEVPKWLPDAYLKRMKIQKKIEKERKKNEK